MSTNCGFSIRIFLPDGNPDSIKIVEKSNWTGVGVVCPRKKFPEAKKRDLFGRSGVYVLFAPPSDDPLPTLYIGEADVVGNRIGGHHRHKGFWTHVVFFVSKDLTINKAHAKYLESRLIELAKKAKKCNLENKEGTKPVNLSEPEIADMQNFLSDMLLIYPILGIDAFNEPLPAIGALELRSKGIVARGDETDAGFTVLKDSQLVLEDTPGIPSRIKSFREELLKTGVIIARENALEFTQNYSFSSPSLASSVVLARASSGLNNWVDKEGRTLREIQKLQAE